MIRKIVTVVGIALASLATGGAVHSATAAPLAPCVAGSTIVVRESDGRWACNPDGSNTVHMIMKPGRYSFDDGSPVLSWRDRCDQMGGQPDTYVKRGRLVRVCFDIDY